MNKSAQKKIPSRKFSPTANPYVVFLFGKVQAIWETHKQLISNNISFQNKKLFIPG